MRFSTSYKLFAARDGKYLAVAMLLVVSAVLLSFYYTPERILRNNKILLEDYIALNQKEFHDLKLKDSLLQKFVEGKLSSPEMQQIENNDHILFLYHDSLSATPVFWSSNAVLPNKQMLMSIDTVGFEKLSNGFYLWQKAKWRDYVLFSVLPIQNAYAIENEYLENSNGKGLRAKNFEILPLAKQNATIVYSAENKALFSIRTHESGSGKLHLPAIMLYAGLIFFYFFLNLFARSLIENGHKPWMVTVGLILIAVIMRLLLNLFPAPFNVTAYDLFNSKLYDLPPLIASPGNLLLNSLIFLWLVNFIRLYFTPVVAGKPLPGRIKWVLLLAGSVLIICLSYVLLYILQQVSSSDSISFDVINVFSLDKLSLVCFIAICSLVTSYHLICLMIISLMKPMFSTVFYELFLAVAVITLLFLTFGIIQVKTGFEVFVMVWLIAYIFLLNNDYFNLFIGKYISSGIVFWMMFFSASLTMVILQENRSKSVKQQIKYAEVLATKSDVASERVMNALLNDFNNTFLSNHFDRFRNSDTAKLITDSIISNNIRGYAAEFKTSVYVFDSLRVPLNETGKINYNQLNAIFTQQAKPTTYDNLFYYDEGFDAYSYIAKREVRNYFNDLQGYVFVLATAGSGRDVLAPEVFTRGGDLDIANSKDFAYGLYNQNKLINSYNDYSFLMDQPDLYFAGKQFLLLSQNGYDELWFNAGKGRTILIAQRNTLVLQAITLFSYFFCGFLVLFGIIYFLDLIYKHRLNSNAIVNELSGSIRTQIHRIISLVSIISFLVVGAITIYIFTQRFNENNRQRLSNTLRSLDNQLRHAVMQAGTDSSGNIAEIAATPGFSDIVYNLSRVQDINFNIYDTAGNLIVTSLPLPYQSGIISNKMNPMAYNYMHHQSHTQFLQNEQVGKLDYLSNYMPFTNRVGQKVGYINIPWFSSGSNLKQELSAFIVNLINLNAFIFIIAGLIALYITNRVTSSFDVIRNKMKAINVGKQNEPIDYKRNDEIGELVEEYNLMVQKLEESIKALTESEREGAWATMARQVAHEIKNPLTPMRLSMQFLQRAIDSEDPNLSDLAKRMSVTMIEQIDHLTNIAGEFSQFANIESIEQKPVNITHALNEVRSLYNFNQDAEITWNLLNEPVLVMGDNTQLNRLFTNLTLNALQAAKPGENVKVNVSQQIAGNRVIVSIRDNGVGIDPEFIEKIFTPNFTTKSSGTGLGLPMCKRIVHKMGGEIFCESVVDVGSLFTVEIPLLQA